MPLPFVGAGIAALARRAAPAAARLAGRALRTITKGKLIGQGGGRAAAQTLGRAAGVALTGATAVTVARDVRNAVRPPTITATTAMADIGGGGSGRTYRRMNPMNPRALNRAIRRLGGAEKLFKKVFAFNHGRTPTQVRPKLKRGSR